MLLILSSCSGNPYLEDNYNDDSIKIVNLDKDNLKIMQITDLHLTYGFDYLDRKTYKLLDKMFNNEKPDLIIITGDLFMTILAPKILKDFINFMESYRIPWSLTFGNHEREYHDIIKIVKILMEAKTNYLLFHYGPKLSDNWSHGYSNFKISINSNNVPFLNLYLLDSKANRQDGIKDKRYPYDYLTVEQVNWFKEEVSNDVVKSLAFMHMPLLQYLEYQGDDIRETVWPQAVDTGFFEAILATNKKTIGVFVGHDHNNEFSFNLDGVLLAYGRNSGYNAYGTYEKGSRIILIDNNYHLITYLVGENDY